MSNPCYNTKREHEWREVRTKVGGGRSKSDAIEETSRLCLVRASACLGAAYSDGIVFAIGEEVGIRKFRDFNNGSERLGGHLWTEEKRGEA